MTKIIGLSLLLVLSACSGSGSSDRNDRDDPSSESSASSASSIALPETAMCLANQFEQPADLGLQRLVPDGYFDKLTGLSFLPGNDNVMYITEQEGKIWRAELDGDSFSAEELVDLNDLNDPNGQPYDIYVGGGLDCNECGLFSLAFHPDFDENGYIYASFTSGKVRDNETLHSYIIRMRSDDGGLTLARDASGNVFQEDIYNVRQPTMTHNNGQVKFGPDGYLYVGFGDGGPGGDPRNHAQTLDNPFGSILRLTDEGEPAPGNLPAEQTDQLNPLPEIFAYGLRNPWQWSFDRETGDIWAGDVGQAQVEEINRIVNGGNYGWPCFEGLRTYRDSCGNDGPFIDPVWDQTHVDGRSITGGFVYRGEALPSIYGVYLFSDYVSGIIWGLIADEDGNYERVQLLPSGQMVTAFAEDNAGELYILDWREGGIYRLVAPEPNPDLQPLPELLSMTGCVNPSDPESPAEHLIPYEINEPFWSDRAEKERFIVLPEGAVIALGGGDDENPPLDEQANFELPVGTTLVKNFRLDGRMIETRLLLNQENTGWTGFSYQWLEDGSDAVLLEGQLDMPVGSGQVWHYPSRAECSQCHTPAAGFSLGLEAQQLSKEIYNPNTGMFQNQLDYFAELGLFAEPLEDGLKEMTMPDSKDTGESLEDRARSFLHSNCANCHRPGGVTQSSLDLRYEIGGWYMNLCNATPEQGDLDIPGARLMVPGDPDSSILWHRLVDEGEHRMPPLGSNVVDHASADLIYDWIGSVAACESPAGPENAPFSLQNRWTDGYLIGEGGDVTLGDDYTVWTLERVTSVTDAFYYRIRTAEEPYLYLWTTNDANNQSLEAAPAAVAPESAWSSHWILVPVGETGYFRLRNRWQGIDIHISNADRTGPPIVGPTEGGWHSAMWRFHQLETE